MLAGQLGTVCRVEGLPFKYSSSPSASSLSKSFDVRPIALRSSSPTRRLVSSEARFIDDLIG